MKIYTKPEVTVTVIKNKDDILVVSGGLAAGKFTKSTKGYTEIKF